MTVVGAPTNEVYVPPVIPTTALTIPIQQAETTTDHFAGMLVETPDNVMITEVGDDSP